MEKATVWLVTASGRCCCDDHTVHVASTEEKANEKAREFDARESAERKNLRSRYTYDVEAMEVDSGQ